MKKTMTSMLLVAALGLTGCASSNAESGGPDGVLLRIEDVGGFLPLELAISNAPAFTLTTDGKLIFAGAVNLIYPGPLVYPQFYIELTPGELSQIRTRIERIGLPDMDDVVEDDQSQFLADASTSVITYWDDSGSHRFSVYGLGIGDAGSASAQAFAELKDSLFELSWSREGQPYEPERIRLVVGQSMQHVEEMFTDLRPWPLSDTDLANWDEYEPGWVCRGFGGDDIAPFEDATQVTTWVNPSGTDPEHYTILARALHPGEPDCK